ncbi:hypothetical protein XENTR_v10024466 [Xenopus tropicalis]|uniref:UDP-glucuronosyltransferase n=1 Tax=Xenopus tropicalis TaxID=8364 RepID=A9ULE5_XENTR|nr:UDP glucuronosyltransferase 1 family, polypeptide A6 precursor [Xenopus tropicalis]AAI57227.1 LOC100135191 protein [Xenopus tropicalis]AAI71210.1 hypothetical protein LOC100135191 [Xenopus tropicalis]AAI71213.1 hypothetical protein LOC100135191 [Xenopus tropicalis]KAE8580563.1 hypothetical protein XENTR_v10024466 [Xenopus tropicalis]|eukprot:XP_012825474.1 PREDICTED: UDP glucuronosyltransferase 1 family, polypeptide A6 isoform X1 [Xenopus tropicalis]
MGATGSSPSCCFFRRFFILLALGCADGGRLLVVPQDGSHWLSMRVLVDRLAQRGHYIVVAIPEVNMLFKDLDNYKVKTFSSPYSKDVLENRMRRMNQEIFVDRILTEKITFWYESMSNATQWVVSACQHFLQNSTLIRELEKEHFDAMLTDSVFPCGEIVAEHLSIPSVSFMRGTIFGMDQIASQTPSPPSYVPRMFTVYTDNMSFSQRVKNFLIHSLEHIVCHIFYYPYAQMASDFLKKEVTAMSLFSRTSIWLMRYDFVFEFPRPIMPNVILIGGINCAKQKALPQEFEKLVKSSGEHGFVVFSFGSMVSEIPMNIAMDIAEALRYIPQKVFWRYTGKAPPNLGDNTHLVKWLPQNDLLAHPKARAFITHAGSHGVYEGICNAVPMVMLPLIGDQMDNAKRIESRGAGLILNVQNLIPDDLSNAVMAVIDNPSYKENIQRLSSLHRDRPVQPLDLAVHWVEFVMKHKGAPHLRPAAHDLNWIQYQSLDVMAFLLAVLLTTLFISLKCSTFACRCCCKRNTKPKRKTKSE